MNVKRVLSGVVLFPIFAVIMVFANTYIIDVLVSIIAIMSLHEFYKALRRKAKPVEWMRIYCSSINCLYPYHTT